MDGAFFRDVMQRRRAAADEAEALLEEQQQQASQEWRDLGLRILAGEPLLEETGDDEPDA